MKTRRSRKSNPPKVAQSILLLPKKTKVRKTKRSRSLRTHNHPLAMEREF
jgi:hypothetical protein